MEFGEQREKTDAFCFSDCRNMRTALSWWLDFLIDC